MATTIPRTPWIDDDGSGTTGTVLNNAIKTELYDQIDVALANVGTAAGTEVIASASAVVTLNPAYRNHEVRFYGTVLHGFTKTGAQEGDEVLVVNSTGLGPIALAHDSTTATTSTDRLWNVATSANTPVTSNGSARYVRDYKTEGASGGNDRWRMVAHEQGAWITHPFAASDFTAATGTWTVEAGDVLYYTYRLSGRTLTYGFYIATSTLSAATAAVMMKLPGGFVYGGGTYLFFMGSTYKTAGTAKVAEAFVDTAGTLTIRNLDTSNLAASADDNYFRFGNITIPVS
jgi:hypothetical protein